jgi:ABC-type sugar transport system substrate-binding protein
VRVQLQVGRPRPASGRRTRRWPAIAASAAVIALLSAACGSSGGGPGTRGAPAPAPPPPASSSASSQVTAAKAALAKILRTSVPMAKPAGPVSVGTHKVAVIAVGLATPGASDTAVYVQDAIKLAGWTAPPTYDGKFLPATASGFIETAVNAGDQAIILVSVTPSTVSSALQLAHSKKVPVVCILCGPASTFSQFPGVIGVEPSPQNVGTAQAQYVVAQSSGTAKVWLYEDAEFPFTQAQNLTAVSVMKSECPGCQVHIVQMKAGDEQVPGIPVLSGVLSANPKGSISYIIAPYDNAAAQFSTLLQQKARTEIGVVGYAALPVFFDQIKAGTPPSAQATVSIPLQYMGFAAVDEAARLLAGKPTWDANSLAVSLVTRTNYQQYSASAPWVSPGFNVPSYFSKLWGKG